MIKALITTAVVLIMAGLVSAQQADLASLRETASETPLGVKPALTPSSLLDVSRMTWSHSYSISFFSSRGGSESVGMLNSTMFYELSPKLSVALNLGVLHNAGALFDSKDREATLLPGFAIDFHPSEKFQMSISFQRYSGHFSPYGWSPYRRSIGSFYPY